MTPASTIPRLLVAAPNSGSGKTTVVCALLAALKKRGLSLTAFKSGPDYIDPMFHRRVLDTPSYNLDLFLFGRGEKGAKAARQLLVDHGERSDLVLLEGAMGYYDASERAMKPVPTTSPQLPIRPSSWSSTAAGPVSP